MIHAGLVDVEKYLLEYCGGERGIRTLDKLFEPILP